MARLRGPDFISLQVRDLAAARAFYTDVLGFSIDPRFDNPDFVLFATNSIPFALAEAKPGPSEAPKLGAGVTLWIDCDAADELYAKMAAAGATIIKEPFDSPFGRAFIFADPDGHRITANENPWDRFPLGGSAGV
jgi:predicted enzyme related to lactoylglutathione lyase